MSQPNDLFVLKRLTFAILIFKRLETTKCATRNACIECAILNILFYYNLLCCVYWQCSVNELKAGRKPIATFSASISVILSAMSILGVAGIRGDISFNPSYEYSNKSPRWDITRSQLYTCYYIAVWHSFCLQRLCRGIWHQGVWLTGPIIKIIFPNHKLCVEFWIAPLNRSCQCHIEQN